MTISNEAVMEMLARKSVTGRIKRYSDETGYPEGIPDHCRHQDQDLIVLPDGTVSCYRCGSNPPGYYTIERNS